MQVRYWVGSLGPMICNGQRVVSYLGLEGHFVSYEDLGDVSAPFALSEGHQEFAAVVGAHVEEA